MHAAYDTARPGATWPGGSGIVKKSESGNPHTPILVRKALCCAKMYDDCFQLEEHRHRGVVPRGPTHPSSLGKKTVKVIQSQLE